LRSRNRPHRRAAPSRRRSFCSHGRIALWTVPLWITARANRRGRTANDEKLGDTHRAADAPNNTDRARIAAEPARRACGLALRSLSIPSILRGGRGASPAVGFVVFPTARQNKGRCGPLFIVSAAAPSAMAGPQTFTSVGSGRNNGTIDGAGLARIAAADQRRMARDLGGARAGPELTVGSCGPTSNRPRRQTDPEPSCKNEGCECVGVHVDLHRDQ
jgi:hypothetical protein